MREARRFLFPGLVLLMVNSASVLLGVDAVVPWPVNWAFRLTAVTLVLLGLITLVRSRGRS